MRCRTTTLSTGLLLLLLGLPAAPAAAPAAERAQAETFMACSAMAEAKAGAAASTAEEERWDARRRLFFAAASAFASEAELPGLVANAAREYERWFVERGGGDELLQRALDDCLRKAQAQRAALEERWATQRRAAWTEAERSGLVIAVQGTRFVHRRSDRFEHTYTPAAAGDRDLFTPYLAQEPLRGEAPWTRRLTIRVAEDVTDAAGLAELLAATAAEAGRGGEIVRAASRPRGNDPADHVLWVVSQAEGAVACAFVRVALQEGQGLVVASTARLPAGTTREASRAWLAEHAAGEEPALWLRDPSVAILRNVRSVRGELAQVPLQVFRAKPGLAAAR